MREIALLRACRDPNVVAFLVRRRGPAVPAALDAPAASAAPAVHAVHAVPAVHAVHGMHGMHSIHVGRGGLYELWHST